MSGVLLLLMGVPASGKSYLAARLAKALGADLVQSDAVRKTLVSHPRYTGEEHAIVFAEAHRVIGGSLAAGRAVVYDATNLREADRKAAYAPAQQSGAAVHVFWLRVPERVAAERLTQRGRARDPDDLSDATWPVYQQLARSVEPPQRPHVHLNGTLPVADLLWTVQRVLGFREPGR